MPGDLRHQFELIRVGRLARGLTQQALAEAAGLTSLWRLSRIERGISPPRPDELIRIVGVLSSEEERPRREFPDALLAQLRALPDFQK